MTRLEQMKQIVANGQAEEIDGMIIDISSASIYVQTYEALNETNKARLDKLNLYQALKIIWDISVR